MNKIKLVIFDMDGLMLDTEKISFISWQKAAKKYGYEVDMNAFKKVLGKNVPKVKETLLGHYGIDFPIDDIIKDRYIFAEQYIDENGIDVKEGLYELLDYLQETGIKTAVATSTRRELAAKHLKMVDIYKYFDCIVCGDEVENSKPNPEIFEKAAQKLCCNNENCIVLEDSEAGIMAAHSAKMYPIVIPDMKEPSEEIEKLAFKRFKNLREVKVFLQQEL
ncbi:HAD family hydrolase [Clostridium oryzae]|uniref:Phosphorylated carbohydrates phosphatase n=1 Tax=Clostridium oryzae TaxID=1450648 RepID=A0A1V4I4G5_9CLOT|nr:HAD family phosphatase [Clostridium oryzae]OPJ54853.1 phosphorylated carbohydrates phosphatase [Clostridium oryzae]